MSNDPKVRLFYPPYVWAGWDGPHLAIPLLSTYLRHVGIDASYVDLNARFRHYLARPNGEVERFAIARLNDYLEYQQSDSLDRDDLRSIRQRLKVISTFPSDLVQEKITKQGEITEGRGVGPIRFDLAVAQLEELSALMPGLSEGVRELIENRTYENQPILSHFFSWEQVTDEISDALSADVVGINVSFAVQLGAALTLAHSLKQKREQLTVVLGGTQITLLPNEDQDALAALKFIDGLILFEGELPLEKLARTVAAKGSFSQVPNLVSRSSDGSILRTETIPALHPNDVPTPQLNESELPLYGEAPQFSLLTTRGCYWGKCTYCDYTRLQYPGHPRYVTRSPEQVALDVEHYISAYGASRFWLVTDALPPKWTKKFSEEIIAKDLQADFSSYMRPEKKKAVKPELARLMKEAGFTSLVLGAESFADRVLAVMNKGTTGEDVEHNLRLFADSGIRVTLNMIPDYPTTTFAEAVDDIRKIIANAPWIEALNYTPFDLTDDTEVALHPEKYGIVVDRTEGCVSSLHGAHSLRFTRTTGMNDAEHVKLMTAFYELSTKYLPRLSMSGENSAKVRHAQLSWEDAQLRFRPFLALPSRFSLTRGGSREDATILLIPMLGTFVELPGYHERVLALLSDRPDVPYPDLLSAYAQDVLAIDPETDEEALEKECREVVVGFVDTSFVLQVEGGGGDGLAPFVRLSPLLSSILKQ